MNLSLPRALGLRVLSEVVRHISDRDLERRFGAAPVQRLLFEGLARSYSPEAADGFRGRVGFELTRPATGGEESRWTVEVTADRAVARPGGDGRDGDRPPPDLTVRVPVADFVRIACGVVDPVEPVLAGRAAVSGDLGTAARLAEMFGAPRPR